MMISKPLKTMDKNRVKEALIALEHETIEESTTSLESFLEANQLDRNGVIDLDAQAQYRESRELTEQLHEQVHSHEEHLEVIDKISFEPTKVIQPGAVFRVNDRWMVIAVTKPHFVFNGKDMMAISTEVPLYECLEGKSVGDQFSFNEVDYTINEIF